MNKRRFPSRRLNTCSLTTSFAADLQGWSLHQAVAELEQPMIRETLAACRFNQVQTAKRLGISRQGLIKKIKRHNIQI